MEMNKYQLEAKKDAEKVMKDFSNLVNSSNFKAEYLVEQFKREHNTLQQMMFGGMLSIMVAMTKDDYYTDGRNHYSKETAKLLVLGYAEMKKQEYLKEHGTDEYYQKRAEEIRQGIIEKPELYFDLPLI